MVIVRAVTPFMLCMVTVPLLIMDVSGISLLLPRILVF